MNYKKPLLIAGVVSSIALTGLAGISAVSAASTTSSTDGPTSLIEKLATKFNLNKDEVKAVFDEQRTEREATRQAKFEEHLTQAVKDGKLTEDQKAKIIAKATELKTAREAKKEEMKDKTPEERRAAKEANRATLEQWAKDNNIPLEYLQFGKMAGHGSRGGVMKGSVDQL